MATTPIGKGTCLIPLFKSARSYAVRVIVSYNLYSTNLNSIIKYALNLNNYINFSNKIILLLVFHDCNLFKLLIICNFNESGRTNRKLRRDPGIPTKKSGLYHLQPTRAGSHTLKTTQCARLLHQ